jgi:hypothetical protein
MIRTARLCGWVGALCGLLNVTATQAVTTTNFPSADIGGGIYASATATVTSGPGYLDILLQNTSPLGPEISGKRANPFITEIEFKYITGFTLNESASYAASRADTLFAQDVGNPAINLSQRNLYYSLVESDSPGMNRCFMSLDADNIKNDSTIGSINVLDGSSLPQEGYAVGFLKPHPNVDSGTVFDTVLFHFAFEEAGIPDPGFYGNASTLIVKFVGGGDYSYKHVANVPEPLSVVFVAMGGMGLILRRKS